MTAIRVELELADGSFTSRMIHAGETVAQFTQNVVRANPQLRNLAAAGGNVISNFERLDDTSKGFLSTLRDLALVSGLVSLGIGKISDISHGWVGQIIEINSEMERLNFQMRSMSQAADPILDAANTVDFLRKKALEVPVSLKALNDGFVKLKSTGIDPMHGAIDAITDGIAAFGGSDEAFERTILAISQMSGKGVIQMEELRQQLGESMPRAVELMARSMGVSMAQLIKDISTGTVQSKPALEQFYAELERTYGGRAQYMMQTFEGQLKRTSTQLQTLSLSGGKGFFAEVKNQLKDLNDFLGSDTADKLGQQLGQALTTVVQALRSGVSFVIDFRNEIIRLGVAIGVAFGANLALTGIKSLVGAFSQLRTEMQLAGVLLQSGREEWALYNSIVQLGGYQLGATRTAMEALSLTTRGLAAGMAAIAPWLTVIGLGIYAAGEYFGLFSNHVKEAYDSLTQFGAETRRQAQEVSEAYIEQLQRTIDYTEKWSRTIASQIDFSTLVKKALGQDPYAKQLDDLNTQLKAALAAQQKLVDDAGKREDEKALSTFKDQLAERLQTVKDSYDKESIAIQDKYDDQRKIAADANKSAQDVETQRGVDLQTARLKEADDSIAILRDSIAKQLLVEQMGNEVQKAQARANYAYLNEQLSDALEQRTQLVNSQANVPKTPKVLSDTALYQKGQKALEKLQSDVAGLQAGLQGADVDAMALQKALQDGKYGDADTQKVKELSAALVDAQAQKSALDDLMKGKNQLDSDIERARVKAIEDRVAIEEKASGKTLSESEKIKLKIQAGYYDGFGPSSTIANMFKGIAAGFDAQGLAANQLATDFQTNTFGTQTVTRINSVNEAMQGLLQTVGDLSGGVSGLDFNSLKAPSQTGKDKLTASQTSQADAIMKMLMDKGWTPNAAGGIVGNLAGESGLNPSSLTIDSNGLPSGGLANWNGDRLTQLKTYSKMLGKDWTDLQTQVDFLDSELRSTESKTGNALRMAASPTAASDIFMRGFERPKDYSSASTRAGYATQAAGLGQDYAPDLAAYTPNAAQIALQQRFNDLQNEALNKLQLVGQAEDQNVKAANQQKVVDAQKDLNAQMDATKTNVDDIHKRYAAVIDDIKKGKFGMDPGDQDVTNSKYKALLDTATQLDKLEKDMNDKKAARTKLDSAQESFAQRQVDIANRVGEATARITDPLELKSTSAFRSLRTELDKYLSDVEKYYGKDAAEYKAALDYKKSVLAQFHNMEVSEAAAGYAQDALTIRRSLMSTADQRQLAFQQQMDQIDREVASFRGSEDEKVEIVQAAEAKKQALRDQYAAQTTPFIGQMKEWGDIQTNLGDSAKGWMDGLATDIAGLSDYTKTWDDRTKALQDTMSGMLQDMATMALKWGFSSLAGGMGIGGSTGGSLLGNDIGGGLGKSFGTAHTGAVVGGDALKAWSTASRYHTGDIVDSMRPKLGSDEVPIIAKKGEGIFTPGQMKALGGFSQTSATMVHNDIHVAGSAGTADQNQQLAEMIGTEIENKMRAMAAEQMRDQMRPGNMLNQRSYGT